MSINILKLCYKCEIQKDICEFVKSQLIRKNSKCKSCQKDYWVNNRQKLSEYNKKYYKQNKEHLDTQHKSYYQVNKDHLLECQKIYLQTNEIAKNNKKEYNKKYGKMYSKEYIKLRNVNDPSFKLRQIVSRSVRAAMKRNNSQKIGSCLKYLLYSIQELKEHYISMEDDNFKKCWSLDNLRPLSAKQNNLDGTSRVRHQLINLTKHEVMIK